MTIAAAVATAGAVHTAVNAWLLRRPPPAVRHLPDVAVLIPARDEQGLIGPCVRAIVGQPGVREVVVLDDGSDDDTAAEARAAGARVVHGIPPPPGWLGKPWACAQLMAEVDDDVLVFVDADVRLRDDAVAAAHAALVESEVDIVYPFPAQQAVGAERIVQPLLQWSWLTTVPLRVAERSARPSLAVACGQFVVARRSALDRAGGFAVVRDAVLDDLALARAVRRAGGRTTVLDGSSLATARMYEGWDDVRAGYGKSLWSAFGSPAGAISVVAGLTALYVLPAAAALCGSRAGAVAYSAGVASRMISARATGGRPVDALVHPVSVGAFGFLTLESLWRRRSGVITWRGRAIR